MGSMDITRKAATSATAADQNRQKTAQTSGGTSGNSLRFTEYGAAGTALESHGCDPYNSTQGKPLQDAWKRRSDRR
jgi:hypothetical protein